MRTVIFLLTIFFIQNVAFAQSEDLARLPVRGPVTELGVSPTGEIWMASKGGNVYYTEQFGELWHIGPFGSLDPMVYIPGETYERINFLSDDILIISGYIQENGKQDFIYRSEDGGQTWNKVVFGKSSWIDAAHFTMNGKGWMSGNSQLIYYTEDFGRTWIERDKVEPTGNLRFSTIHFAPDQSIGLFGSFWNKVYRTDDNCLTWERIETPLQQGKYDRISTAERPDIRKIRILGDHYLINQQGRIYYTKSDDIDWIPLPDIIDFEVSDSLGYLIDSQLGVQLIDANFSKIWKSENQLSAPPKALKVIGPMLYSYSGEEIFRISPDSFERSQLLTDEIPIPEPYMTLDYNGEKYGFDGTDILTYKRNRWIRMMESPFPIGNAAVFQGRLIISDYSLTTRLEINTDLNQLQEYDLPENIFESHWKVKRLTIGLGSMGCFHYDDQSRIYELRGGVLRLKESDDLLNNMPRQLELETINEIISIANTSRLDELTLADLELTSSDYSDYVSFVSEKEEQIQKDGMVRVDFGDPYCFPGERTDFNFYKQIVDSLSSMDNNIIGQVFSNGYGNRSTTRIWHQLIFDFQGGGQLIIYNSDDIPNYLYTPWLIDFNGLIYKTNSLELGRAIDELTNGQFYEDYANDPTYALFKISDYLYRRKLETGN